MSENISLNESKKQKPNLKQVPITLYCSPDKKINAKPKKLTKRSSKSSKSKKSFTNSPKITKWITRDDEHGKNKNLREKQKKYQETNSKTDDNIKSFLTNKNNIQSEEIVETKIKKSIKKKMSVDKKNDVNDENVDLKGKNIEKPIIKKTNNKEIKKAKLGQNLLGNEDSDDEVVFKRKKNRKKVSYFDSDTDEEIKPKSVKSKSVKQLIKKSPVKDNVEKNKRTYIDLKIENNNKVSKKRNSFSKYGIRLPTFEEMKKEKENLKIYTAKLENVYTFVENYKNNAKQTCEYTSPKKVAVVLGCEYLNLKDIDKYFDQNKQYCKDIITEKIKSERHCQYISAIKDLTSASDVLTYNTSMIAFSHTQIQRLAKLCHKYFHKYDINNHNQYYFKVLLPELCLKIFMDVHKLSQDAAVKYLDERPVVDLK